MRLIDLDKAVSICDEDNNTVIFANIKNAEVKAIPIDKPFLKARYGDYVVYNKKWLVNHLQTEWNILQGKEYQPSIPTEWIKKYASMKRTNDEMDCYWHFWEEDVLKMVEDWEKENESGSTESIE